MSTLYLCIGTMKTGTTSLQNFLRNNPEALEKQGFCYPLMNTKEISSVPIPQNRNGHFLIFESANKNLPKKEEKGAKIRELSYQKLQELTKDFPNIVLFEELIWHHFQRHENFWEKTVENMKKIHCELKVVVYLRRQDLLIQSLWKQMVQSNEKRSYNFDKYILKKRYRYFPLDYYSHLKKIADVVGKENLLVRIYENGQFEGEEHTLISDFMHTLNLSMTDDFIQEANRRNPSLNGNFVEMKRILNGLPEYQEMHNFMLEPLLSASLLQESRAKGVKQSLFSYEDQTAFLKEYEESNQKAAKEFLNREDGILFRDPVEQLPRYEATFDIMYRDLLLFIGEEFCRQQKKIKSLENQVYLQERIFKIISLPYQGYKKIKKHFS